MQVAVLENKLQCTVEALHLLNTESEEQKNDESTASELVRLEAWIAEEAMQRRRLQEKLSSGGINVDSPGPGAVRLGCSLGSRGSPAVSEVSDDAWAGLESTVRQIEGQGSAAPKADRSSKRHPADSRLNLIEQAVRELTEQVGDVMTQQAQHTVDVAPQSPKMPLTGCYRLSHQAGL